MNNIKKIWERNYKNKRFNNYPFDRVVSFIFKNFKQKNKKKIKVLDLGCGGGNNSLFLAKEGFDLYAIDGSSESIKITRKKLKFYDKKKIIKCNFTKLPFKNNFFDCIIDRQSLSCNSFKDIKRIVKEIYRVSKPSCRIISFVYSLKHPDIKYGKKIKEDISNSKVIGADLDNFKKGIFKKSGLIHFFSENQIFILFSSFRKILIFKDISMKLINSKKYETLSESFILEIKK